MTTLATTVQPGAAGGLVTAAERARHLLALTDAEATGLSAVLLGRWSWAETGWSLARLAERAHREAALLADELGATA